MVHSEILVWDINFNNNSFIYGFIFKAMLFSQKVNV